MFGRKNEGQNDALEEQRRYLAFGSILFTHNNESCRTIKLSERKGSTKRGLRNWWGIKDSIAAQETAKELSIADGHTPFADDIYQVFIKKGNRAPFTPKGLESIAGLEKAYKATAKRTLYTLGIPESAMTPEFMEEMMADDEFRLDVIPAELFERLTRGLECYKGAKAVLINAGYTEQELMEINTLAAWDYGRTGFVARSSAHVGFLTEDEAWQFMKTAAENATERYESWREYVAAYIFGRAIGFGNDSSELYTTIYYLLSDNESPMRLLSFK